MLIDLQLARVAIASCSRILLVILMFFARSIIREQTTLDFHVMSVLQAAIK